MCFRGGRRLFAHSPLRRDGGNGVSGSLLGYKRFVLTLLGCLGRILFVNGRAPRLGNRVGSERLQIVATDNRRLNVVDTGSTLRRTRGEKRSLIGVTPRTGPPITGVVSCDGFHCRRTGHRGRGHGGRGVISAGRVHLSLGVSVNSFGAGIGRTGGFLSGNSGLGISVHLHNERVTRSSLNITGVREFIRTLNRSIGISGTPGLRNERVLVFISLGSSDGWYLLFWVVGV